MDPFDADEFPVVPCLLLDALFATVVKTNPDLAKARAEYEKASPANRRAAAEWHYLEAGVQESLGGFLALHREPSQFIEVLLSLAVDPEYAPAMLSVATLEYEYGREDEAMAILLGLANLPPETEDLAVVIDKAGDFLCDRSDYERAERLWGAAAKAFPDEGMHHSGLCYCAGKLDHFEASVAHARRAVALEPENADYANNLGFSLFEFGVFDEAEEVLSRAISLDPENADLPRGNLEVLADARGKQDNASSPS